MTTFTEGEMRSPLGTDTVWEYVKPHTSKKDHSWWRRIGKHPGVSSHTAAVSFSFPDWIVERYWRVR